MRLVVSIGLIATCLATAPAALAQQTPAMPQESDAAPSLEEPPASDESQETDFIVVQGQFIPEPLQVTAEVAAFLTEEDLIECLVKQAQVFCGIANFSFNSIIHI
jgi:cell division septation protein DedD